MPEIPWFKEFSSAITICDAKGILLDMNDAAEDIFKDDGGRALIGSNVLDCHPNPARGKLERMMDKKTSNVYFTVEKGKRRLFFQTPWYRDGQYAGFIEISFEVSAEIPTFNRN